MKAKTFFFGILFLFLAPLIFIGCEAPEVQEDFKEYNFEKTINKINGVSREIRRPGDQNS